jgi:hypothetical protein
MNGLRKCGIYTHFYLVTKKNKILSFTGKWMELENIILSDLRLRRPRLACSSSYVDYRPKTNAAILLDTGYTLKGDCTQEG